MEKLKVLVPTDFSVQAEYAFLMVKKIAEQMPVDVHFLHVMNMPDTVSLDSNGNVSTCGEIDVRYVVSQKDIAERKLNELKVAYGNAISTHLRMGKITDQILEFSTEKSFDMIVMGTKGAFGLKEKISGSETQMIARKSSIPVLSLMCDRSDLVINHILLVHDFRDPMKDDLSLLKKMLKAFNAKLHQLQIVKKEDAVEREVLLSIMDAHASEHGFSNYENHVLSDSDVEHGVIHFNQMHDIDLVCIGTHGKGGLLHNSATEKLINHLFKPIISFHLN